MRQPFNGKARTRVALSGLPLFCSQVADAARAYVPECDVRIMHTETRGQVLVGLLTLLRSDVWYIIGAPQQDRLLRWFAKVLGRPQVLHWVGSDILHLDNRPLRGRLRSPLYTHLAEVDWTQRELYSCGIEAGIAPLPIRYNVDGDPAPLPDEFTLLLYLPRNRSETYGMGEYRRLMLELAGERVKYLIVGGGSMSVPDGVDCENLGWQEDLSGVYRRSTALVRFTPRDGLSLMALEALSFGRYVIWTQPLPHVQQVTSYRELRDAVRHLLELHKKGALSANVAARNYIRDEYQPAESTRKIADVWQNIAEDRPAPKVHEVPLAASDGAGSPTE